METGEFVARRTIQAGSKELALLTVFVARRDIQAGSKELALLTGFVARRDIQADETALTAVELKARLD